MRSPGHPALRHLRARASALAILGASAIGCGGEGAVDPAPPPIPWGAEAMPAPPEPVDNPGTPEKAELGRLLFYDPILSSDKTVACATCHSEIWGMSDGLPRSIGIGGMGPTGPGREGPNLTRRNSLTLWNAVYRTRLFVDGRASSLEEQVLAPLHEPAELGRDPEAVVTDLAAIPGYVERFQTAFPGDAPAVTVVNLQRAIAAFERTMITNRSPYDLYVAGDMGALDEASLRGILAFSSAGCASCHAPPLFESDTFANRGVDPAPGVDDRGREEITHNPADRGAFRVPTLRNIRETGPYFHTGGVDTLQAAVEHEASLGDRALSSAEIADIVTFLKKALIDPSRAPGRPKDVPSGLPVPVDGFRIPR